MVNRSKLSRNEQSAILTIDRFKPVDLQELFEGGAQLEKEHARSLTLTELDLSKVRLKTMLREGEQAIGYQEKWKRLHTADYVPLDVQALLTLLRNKHLIPEDWKNAMCRDYPTVCFDGTIIWSGWGECLAVPCLFCKDNDWRLSTCDIQARSSHAIGAYFSAVLANS